MPRKKLEVRKIHDVLRLSEQGFSQREIAQSLGCARSTVGDTLCRAEAAGLSYATARDLSDAELYARLYPGNTGSARRRVEPDYEFLHRELRRADADVTLQQLWLLCRSRHNSQSRRRVTCLWRSSRCTSAQSGTRSGLASREPRLR